MLTITYTYACDFCPEGEHRVVEHHAMVPGVVLPNPAPPYGWTAAYGDRVACEKHRVVVVDREDA